MVKYTSQKQVKLDSNRGRFSVDVRTVLEAMIVNPHYSYKNAVNYMN